MQILWDAFWTCQLGVTEDKRHLCNCFYEPLSLKPAVWPHRTLISLSLIWLFNHVRLELILEAARIAMPHLLVEPRNMMSQNWRSTYFPIAFFNVGIFILIDILLKFYFLNFIKVNLRYKKNCTHLLYTFWWLWTYIYTSDTITSIKVWNIPMTSKDFLVFWRVHDYVFSAKNT